MQCSTCFSSGASRSSLAVQTKVLIFEDGPGPFTAPSSSRTVLGAVNFLNRA